MHVKDSLISHATHQEHEPPMGANERVTCEYTPECHVNTNPGNELVVMTSIFGKREFVCVAVKWGIT